MRPDSFDAADCQIAAYRSIPTAINGTRRRAECPVCGRPFLVRADGLLRRHLHWPSAEPCRGSYVDCTSEGTAT